MEFKRHIPMRAVPLYLLALFVSATASLFAQGRQESVPDLVASLTKPKLVCVIRGFTTPYERGQAMALLALGEAAIPQIEEALDSLQQGKTQGTCGTEWLLYTFARLRKETAYSRLKAMLSNPNLAPLSRGIENAMAVSLQLTSVVSSLGTPDERPGDTRPGIAGARSFGYVMPQDSLDRFLLGWIRDRKEDLEASLTPEARDTLRQAVTLRMWNSLRRSFREGLKGQVVEIGYRLRLPPGRVDFPGPESPIDFNPPYQKEISGRVEFYSQGKNCAQQEVRFVDSTARTEDPSEHIWRYLIATDAATLLNTLRGCH